MGAALARRLLDPRRLPQLGHRPRLLPLASAQEGRAGPAGAGRRRRPAGAAARPALGQLGEVAARSRPQQLRRARRGRAADPGTAGLRRQRGSGDPGQRLPGRHAGRGQRLPRTRRRSRPAPRGAAACVVLVRSRHRPPGRHHPGLQHRDRRGQPARDPVRRPRHRPALRRPAGGRGEHWRVRPGGLRPDRARPGPHAARHPVRRSPVQVRSHPAAVDASAARRGCRHRSPTRLRGPVHRPPRARVRQRARADGDHRLPLHPALHRRALDAAWPPERRCVGHVPQLGAWRSRAGAAARREHSRAGPLAAGAVARPRAAGDERAQRLSREPARRLRRRGGQARRDAPAAGRPEPRAECRRSLSRVAGPCPCGSWSTRDGAPARRESARPAWRRCCAGALRSCAC